MREPDAFNVSDGVAISAKFASIPAGSRNKIRLAFYVQTKNGARLPKNLRLNLYIPHEDEGRSLELLPTGELILPSLSEQQAKGSELFANLKRGSLRIVYFVQVVQPDKDMSGVYLKDALVQARGAWKVLYGPVKGLFVPVFDCARGIYDGQGVVKVSHLKSETWSSELGGQLSLPLRIVEDDSIVDWGRVKPLRIGGCLINGTKIEP